MRTICWRATSITSLARPSFLWRKTPLDYSAWQVGRNGKLESYNSVTDKVLRRVENTWEQPLDGATWPLTQADTGATRANDPQITQSVTTLVAQNGGETDMVFEANLLLRSLLQSHGCL